MKKALLIFMIFLCLPVLFYGQQLENPGFENWEDAGTVKDEPVDWSTIKTSDDPGISSVAPVTFEQSTDVHSGNYALKLYNLAVFGIVATGAITNGRFHAEFDLSKSYSFTQQDDPKWNTPFTWRPDSLTGWFKFFPREDDRCQFKVILHKRECELPENGTMPNWVGMAAYFTEPGVTYSNWTRFSVPFDYFKDSIPEFELTVINSGDSTSAVDSSYLIVDDIAVVYKSAGISEQNIQPPYLAVADHKLILDLPDEREYIDRWFYIIDINGQTLLTRRLETNEIALPDNFSPGIYVAMLKGKTHQYSQKIMIP